jgi:hypothetical protein
MYSTVLYSNDVSRTRKHSHWLVRGKGPNSNFEAHDNIAVLTVLLGNDHAECSQPSPSHVIPFTAHRSHTTACVSSRAQWLAFDIAYCILKTKIVRNTITYHPIGRERKRVV